MHEEMNTSKQFQVALDGPAASGKSTVARLLAGVLGGYYINTGDMYRTIAWQCNVRGIDPDKAPEEVAAMLQELELRYRIDAGNRPQLYLNGAAVPQSEVRSPATAAIVSQVARIPAVRQWLLERQRECTSLGIIIMEGRDIGTVIFPRAKYKFFVTASPMERARRRMAQPGEVPPGTTLEQVAAAIAERDRIDSTRPIAPLKPAEDAETIVTDGLDADAVTALIADRIRRTEEEAG